MNDDNYDSFNDGYDAHEDGKSRDSFTDEHIAEYFEEGWDTACHYAGDGTYAEIDGPLRSCVPHAAPRCAAI